MTVQELHDIVGVSLVWLVAGGLAYSGYSLSRHIQRRRFLGHGSEPEIADPVEQEKVVSTFTQMAVEYKAEDNKRALAHEAWQIENWKRIPHIDQLRCTSRLWRVITPQMIDKWVKQKAAGEAIASDDFWFHHGMGRAIRNELRKMLPDERLPAVSYPDGKTYHNWDDFYRGTLNDMIEQAVVAYKVGAAA